MTALFLECPSGIAGNLFATALVECGVPSRILEEMPARLSLPQNFAAVRRNGVWDGVWDASLSTEPASSQGPVSVMGNTLHRNLEPDVAHVAARILEARWRFDSAVWASGETWSDTLFDAAVAAQGLAHLGWPKVFIAGSLPAGKGCHRIAESLLSSWQWEEAAYEVEVVTPTGAAILSVCATQVSRVPANAVHTADIRGTFCVQFGLPSMRVFQSPLKEETA